MTKPTTPTPCRVTVYLSSSVSPNLAPVFKTYDLKDWPEDTESSLAPTLNLIGELSNGKRWEIYTNGPVIIEEL
jgi:hypothetical protein